MDLLYNYTDAPPQFVTYKKHLGQKIYTINYHVEHIDYDEQHGQPWRYSTVTLPVGRYDRATVISAVIRQRYSDDEMQAIINNYLLDPTDAEAIMEFNAMQDYRRFAKSLADEFIKEIE